MFFCWLQILSNINITINKGQRIGIIGTTGSGKSTFVDLLMGLISPTSGRILVDGDPLVKQNILPWQKHIAHVSQDVFILDSSFIENIAFGVASTDIDMQRVELSARIADIDGVIENMDDGYYAMVGERGSRLSGGQRQAVAIARATAFDAKIVIMDEPTAALAVKEVGKVLDLIKGLKNLGVGVIVISHRMDDIFTVSDRVMALFQGTNFAESQLRETSRDEVIGWIMGKKI